MSMVDVAVVIGAAGAIGGSVYEGISSQKSISAEEGAVNSEQGVNIPQVSSLASQTDLAKYQADFAAQASIDPQYTALRNQGSAGVLGVLADQANPNSIENTAVSGAAKSVAANVPQTQSAIDNLISQAQQELAAGATLPPSFQAEMVRSGLANGGAATGQVNGEGATGVGIRTLLGSAGIQLQQQRAQEAEGELGTASGLQAQQQGALDELTQLSANLNSSKASNAAGAAGMGTAALPSIGLSGSQAASLSAGNTNLANQKAASLGNLQAQSAAANGQMIGGILGGVSGAFSGLAGNYAASGNSGWLANLISSNSNNGGVTGSSAVGGSSNPYSLSSSTPISLSL
jgi:hypothetical protein